MDPEIQKVSRSQVRAGYAIGSSLAQIRASDGYVKGVTYIDTPDLAPNPSYEAMSTYLEIYQRDAIMSSAIDTVGEETMKNGGYFIGPKREVKRARELFTRLNFDEIAVVHTKTKHIFGDSFLELKPDDSGSISELNTLETTEMYVLYDEHGEIVAFEQRPNNSFQDPNSSKTQGVTTKKWLPSDIYFSRLKPLGSKVRSYSPLDPALNAIATRTFANAYINNVFKNFKPQVIYSIENNVSPEQVKTLVDAIRAADKDPSKKLLSVGELKVNTSGMYEFKKDIVDIFNYLRQEILTVTKVPGIYVGITQDSNRGVGEFEATAFQTHLLRQQRDIERLARVILEREGIGCEYKCRPPSVKSQTDIIDQAKKLRDMGYGDDVITPFLFENGINVPVDAEFEEENKVSMDDMPSRQGSDKGVTEGKYSLDENGRSDSGKEKTEEMDSEMRSAPSDLEYLKKRLGLN